MDRGFLSQEEGAGGRGVKEKQQRSTNIAEKDTVVVSSLAAMEVESTSVVEEIVEKEKLSPVVNTSDIGSHPPLPMQETTSAGNALGKSSYANVTGKPSEKKLNIRTLFTPGVMSSYARVVIELRADVELKDNIVVAMPRIKREGHYLCNVRVEYEWKPSRCASCKVFGHIHEKCPKNTCAGEKKTVKKPSQTSRGDEPTIEVNNSNPFNVLNSIDNDVEFGTNGETTNLVNNGATSSGSSFMNVDNSSSVTTIIIEKIEKFEDLITSGQAILVDKDDNPLKKIEFSSEYDSEDEVASVDNDMTRSMAYERGFGTQSLLE
nr:hypothetical protein [Tanacetum cinerariifolium]